MSSDLRRRASELIDRLGGWLALVTLANAVIALVLLVGLVPGLIAPVYPLPWTAKLGNTVVIVICGALLWASVSILSGRRRVLRRQLALAVVLALVMIVEATALRVLTEGQSGVWAQSAVPRWLAFVVINAIALYRSRV